MNERSNLQREADQPLLNKDVKPGSLPFLRALDERSLFEDLADMTLLVVFPPTQRARKKG